jgi:YadA-like membrane anchor domain
MNNNAITAVNGITMTANAPLNMNGGSITNANAIGAATVTTTNDVSIGGNLDMTNGSISNVTTLSATGNISTTVGNITTNTGNVQAGVGANALVLNGTTGIATFGTGGNAITLNGTNGNASIGGNLDMTNGNINNVATLGATTVNAGTVNAGLVSTTDLTVTNQAQLNGGALMGGTLDMNGNGITNVASIGNGGTPISVTDQLNLNGNGIENSGLIRTGGGDVRTQGGDVNTGGGALRTQGGNLNLGGTGNIVNANDITAAGVIQGGTLQTTTGGVVATGSTVTVGTNPLNRTTINNGTVTTVNLNAQNGTFSNSLTASPGAVVSMGGNRVQDVASPIVGTDAANKNYVDAGLAEAFKRIDKTNEGVAVAIALGGIALPQGKSFAIAANMGFWDNKQAFAAQTAIRLNETWTFNGGIGVSTNGGNVGGRVGIMAAW